jgi:hypothetical protein
MGQTQIDSEDSVIRTVRQVEACLAIVRTLDAALMHGMDAQTGEDLPPALDGGAKAAVETTIIAACQRLDSILEDGPRWDVSRFTEAERARKGFEAAAFAAAPSTKLSKRSITTQ